MWTRTGPAGADAPPPIDPAVVGTAASHGSEELIGAGRRQVVDPNPNSLSVPLYRCPGHLQHYRLNQGGHQVAKMEF